MALGMAVLWGAVILGAAWFVRSAGPRHAAEEPPLDILRRRLAQGEITIEEFERRSALLEPRAAAGAQRGGQPS